jgi:potassium efflux system protein
MAVCITKSKPIHFLNNTYKKYLLLLCAVFISFSVFAQQKNATAQTGPRPMPVDTTKKDFVTRARKVASDEAKKSVILYEREKEEIKQEELIEGMKKITQQVKIYIKAGIDSAEIDKELEDVKTWSKFVGDGVFTNKGTSQTHRNLSTTSKILIELLNRTTKQKKEIDAYEKGLVNFRFKMDSLYADSAVYDFPKDSVQIMKYIQKIVIVVKEIAPADTALKYAINNVRKLQDKTNLVVIDLRAQLAEIEEYQNELSVKTFDREFANVWDEVGYARPFNQILYFSAVTAKLNLTFYTENNPGRILLILLLVATSCIFLRSLKKILAEGNSPENISSGHLVLRYTMLSALVIVLCLGQFIFSDPPFIFNCLFWIIASVSLTFIFKDFISRYWMMVWLTFLTLFILSCGDNLVLQASRDERWGMIFLAAAGGIFGLYVLLNQGKGTELREKLILYFIGLAVLLEFTSVFANMFGRYNFSKTLLIGGYLNVVIGILFLWVVRLIDEGLHIASGVYTQQDKKLFYINFDRVGKKAPPLLYFLLILGWFILFGRNFYIFKLITDPLKDFFFNERTIGNYTFTINNLLIFFLIISISVIASKIVSYFASEKSITPSATPDKQDRKAGVGSWLLLIRVAIISTGLFLALAASGFPIEKITIIIGALGVGIGLGLQTLVNNLVSGLIIAFEKPVNVGDIVEISGQGGTVKSIGFRSSIISKWDGPDMVIPNGDLLNAHLINWTLAGSKRQMEIVLGVAYGTDLQRIQQIILDLIATNKRIHEHPKPGVIFKNFNSSAIDIDVTFWVRDYKDGASVRSEVIAGIDKTFRENDIVIPIPQQDLYMHTAPDPEEPVPKTKPKNLKEK